jgi:hypothetical protein
VVRSEALGFAAVADMGFRMQLPDARSLRRSPGESGGGNGGSKHEAIDADANKVFYPVPRFWM